MGMDHGHVRVLAAGAHPDDIEFFMAGTLLRLKSAGAAIFMWNIANGCCGTAFHDRDEIIKIRWSESQASAELAGATIFPPVVDDMSIFYEPKLLARATAVVRKIEPHILLVPSPEDYVEDHQNACRLLVGAAFARGMRNYVSDLPLPPWDKNVVIYHAQPHGNCNSLRQLIRPGQYVDITTVMDTKRAMLKCHASQKEWLDVSQGMGAYINEMEKLCRQVGRLSGRFEIAEGWRRHLHYGYGPADCDPLSDLLREACWVDPDYGVLP